ncbi:MAG TPA: hypothetical protein VGL91_06640, partial [Acidobacteriota bacterium]
MTTNEAFRLRLCDAAFLVFLCWSYNGPLQAEDSLHPLVDAIQNRYDAIRSFSAGFTQIYRSG